MPFDEKSETQGLEKLLEPEYDQLITLALAAGYSVEEAAFAVMALARGSIRAQDGET